LASKLLRAVRISSPSFAGGAGTDRRIRFADCQNIRQIKLPQTLTQMGPGAFANCAALQELDVPEGIAAISDNLLEGCVSLQAITLPSLSDTSA